MVRAPPNKTRRPEQNHAPIRLCVCVSRCHVLCVGFALFWVGSQGQMAMGITYGSILGWMNIHLPPILMFTRGLLGFDNRRQMAYNWMFFLCVWFAHVCFFGVGLQGPMGISPATHVTCESSLRWWRLAILGTKTAREASAWRRLEWRENRLLRFPRAVCGSVY